MPVLMASEWNGGISVLMTGTVTCRKSLPSWAMPPSFPLTNDFIFPGAPAATGIRSRPSQSPAHLWIDDFLDRIAYRILPGQSEGTDRHPCPHSSQRRIGLAGL